VLIGLSASLFFYAHGRVAGISGLFSRVLARVPDGRAPRAWFLLGLLVAGIVAFRFVPSSSHATRLVPLAIAGVLVGVGTRMANGCTSGHGVCGISRLSLRSIVATMTFMVTAMISVFVARRFS
jgi:uncharacterized membrane protein YedE/YeeE